MAEPTLIVMVGSLGSTRKTADVMLPDPQNYPNQTVWKDACVQWIEIVQSICQAHGGTLAWAMPPEENGP